MRAAITQKVGYVFQSWRKKTEIEEEVNLQIDTF